MTSDKPTRQQIDAEIRDSPTYWFVVLEAARQRGAFEQAAEAKRELERLGVRVVFSKPRGVSA
jgi:hypothetical protein